MKEWLSIRLEEIGWKDQLIKDCVDFANKVSKEEEIKDELSSENSLKDNTTNSLRQVTLEQLVKQFSTKAQGIF